MPKIQIGSKVSAVNQRLAAAMVKMGKAQLVTKDEKPPKVESPKAEAPQAEKPRTYKRKDMTAEVK